MVCGIFIPVYLIQNGMIKHLVIVPKMKIEKIKLDKNNRMLRIGFGKNKDRKFFRIDLWCVGYRLS